MTELSMGILGRSAKENERRLPIHPTHFERIDRDLRERIWLEHGYGTTFGVRDEQLAPLVAGFADHAELVERTDVLLLPKPTITDVERMREGQVLWGWPHCVQDPVLTQAAVDRRLTLIAWEAMNHWDRDGHFVIHVFHLNNELAGYASVLQAMSLRGMTGHYGRKRRAVLLGFGNTARGAATALRSLGVTDIVALTMREVHLVADPVPGVTLGGLQRRSDIPGRTMTLKGTGPIPTEEYLAGFDIIVNCVLQDTDDPMMFLTDDDLAKLAPGTLIVDVSCDEAMGFSFARPTTFADPMFTIGDEVHYYAVDHSPSYLWESATWENSEALIPHLRSVMSGDWSGNETIARAIEIRDGVIRNPKILSFQHRSPDYPHRVSLEP